MFILVESSHWNNSDIYQVLLQRETREILSSSVTITETTGGFSHSKVGCQHHLKTNINLVPTKISKSIRLSEKEPCMGNTYHVILFVSFGSSVLILLLFKFVLRFCCENDLKLEISFARLFAVKIYVCTPFRNV